MGFLAITSALPSHEQLQSKQSTFERAQSFIRHMEHSDTFNATEQYISTAGEHRFIPPLPADLRGPCPFLNAAANHGYIDRSGYTTTYEVVAVAVDSFGMGKDLATFLALYAAVTQGEVTSFSIGGAPSPSQAARFPGQYMLGGGLSSSNLEGDGSPLTLDTCVKETGSSSRLAYFAQLLSQNEHLKHVNFDMPTLADFRATRIKDSIANNKFYYYGPTMALIMQPMIYSFIVYLQITLLITRPVIFQKKS